MTKPIAWTIAGSDPGGGAGIQADLQAMQALSVHACTVIACVTAQNSCEITAVDAVTPALLREQCAVLWRDLPPKAIKLGALGSAEIIATLAELLPSYAVPIVIDPVLVATSGGCLLARSAVSTLVADLLPLATLITPNRQEALQLLGLPETSELTNPELGQRLLQQGAQRVLITGGDSASADAVDYYCDSSDAWVLASPRVQHGNTHGTGCALSAAITAGLAQGLSIVNAIVQAKILVNQCLQAASHNRVGHGPGPLQYQSWQPTTSCLPRLSRSYPLKNLQFPTCVADEGAFYPLVDNLADLRSLIDRGYSVIQLRIKTIDNDLESTISDAVALAQQHHTQLFINDHWQLALKYKAYGVHVGQSDLDTVDLTALACAQIRLGISTHDLASLARARAINPSYIAFGPIFPTQSKLTWVVSQGLQRLRLWRQLVDLPLVAIGAINQNNAQSVRDCGADLLAVLSASKSLPLRSQLQ